MEIKKKILYATFLGSAVLFQQCNNDEPAAKKREVEVYVGGELNIGAAHWAAAFTKNGVMDTLENGSVESRVYDITSSGNNIYMSGFVEGNAAYWKNGEVTVPTPGAGFWNTIASNIFVKGEDVYMAGRTGTNNGDQVVYWKNGVPTLCGAGEASWNGSGLVVSDDNDIYMSGTKDGGAGYWKNGNWNLVSDPLEAAYGVGLAIDGSDIYIAGYRVKNDAWTACYWKNGNVVDLGGPGSFGYEIKIIHGDVYVAGHSRELGTDNVYRDMAAYWKNGEQVTLSNLNGGNASYAYNISVKGNDVYVSGEIEYACDYKIVVWKNGEMVAPFNGNQACYFGDFYTMYVR